MIDDVTAGLGLAAAGVLVAACLRVLLFAYRDAQEAGTGRLEEKYPGQARRLAFWTPRWSRLVSALIILSTLVQFASIWVAADALWQAQLASLPAGLLLAALWLLLLVSNSLLPRVVAAGYADRLSVASLPLVGVLAVLLYPFTWTYAWLEQALLGRVRSTTSEQDRPSSEDEIMSLVDQEHTGDLEEHERDIIRSVFEFGDTDVHEIMTPRVAVEGIEDSETVAACIERIRDLRYSRFPVYHETLDDVRGIVHVKALLRHLSCGESGLSVSRAANNACFVPESMPIDELLKKLRGEQNHAAIVVDEYGGMAGLVTMEDIIEELLGDIQDEYDQEEPELRRLPDGSVLVDARMSVAEFNVRMETHVPQTDEYDSLGGYVFSALERIPAAGEVLQGEDYCLTVHAASDRQIHLLRVTFPGGARPDPLPEESP